MAVNSRQLDRPEYVVAPMATATERNVVVDVKRVGIVVASASPCLAAMDQAPISRLSTTDNAVMRVGKPTITFQPTVDGVVAHASGLPSSCCNVKLTHRVAVTQHVRTRAAVLADVRGADLRLLLGRVFVALMRLAQSYQPQLALPRILRRWHLLTAYLDIRGGASWL